MAGLIDIQLWQMIFTIVNMLILYFALKHFLFVPVKTFMDNRTNEIQTSIAQAEEKNKAAEKALIEYQEKLALAHEEGRAIVHRATDNAERKAEEIVDQAKNESTKIKNKTLKDIEVEKEKALRDIKSEVADMAIQATEKLIGKTLDSSTNKSLIDEVINEIGDESWSS